jgi:hypothetical protein
VRAAVRSVSSPDVDVRTYRSRTPEDDGLLLSVYVGPDSGPGEESFDLIVCTPLWLKRKIASNGPVIGRHHLIIDPLDLQVARRFLIEQVGQLEAPTWQGLAEKIARIGKWEFEDYRPYEG